MKKIQMLLASLGAFLGRYVSDHGLVAHLNLYSQKTYDASLLLKAAGLVAATANGALILDVGIGLLDCALVIDATAVEIDTTDESYEVIVQGSPDATFATAGNIVSLGSIVIGHASSVRLTSQGQGTTDVPGRFLVPIRNEKNGVLYRYMRLRTVVVGTIATGINYSAWLAKE